MHPHTETGATLVVDGQPLEYDVYRADSLLAKAVGVMGRRGVPDETALVFPCDDVDRRFVHMIGVREPIRVWWVRDGALERSAHLSPWIGSGAADADLVVELPADAPDLEPGTRVEIRESEPATPH